MHSDFDKNMPRFLGAAFLLQASASLISGLTRDSLIGKGDITDIMTKMSDNTWLVRLSIMSEMITSIGVIILGVLLYLTLKKQDIKIALIALGLYLMEVVALVISQIALFALLHISQESVKTGHPENLQTLGTLFLEIQEFTFMSVVMFFFTFGATLFYYLFYKSGYLPQRLALFGLVIALLSLINTIILLTTNILSPIFFVLILHLPFELGTGLWLLAKGFKDGSEKK